MNSNSSRKLAIAVAFLVQLLGIASCSDRIFSFEMHSRLFDRVRKWSASSTGFSACDDCPREGSYEYYAELAARDRMLRSRSLLDMTSPLELADGNLTVRISSLAFLHYTTIKIGKPARKFMVALDTGSDLLWVPCNCTRCVPTQPSRHSSGFELGIYDPKWSSTSKVGCDNPLCLELDECLAGLGHCPYSVSYLSANTSSSGFLAEDVLHLTSEDQHDVTAYITFGCSLLQTGSFIEVAAPNGLLGLGMEEISVPSLLSKQGLISNSFSMCFGLDGVGRINLGDRGSEDQNETPLNMDPSRPSYNVTIYQIRVGTTLMDLNITSIFDSGTSFTYLTEPAYRSLSESFDSQIQDARRHRNSVIPFEYCYDMGSNTNTMLLPRVSLIMKGGDQFVLHEPVIAVSTDQPRSKPVYCLAVMNSRDINIIGRYLLVFDRERLVLGWKKQNCFEKKQRRWQLSDDRFHIGVSNSNATSSGLPATPSYHVEHVGSVWAVVGAGYLVVALLAMVLFKIQHCYLNRRVPTYWWLMS
ncbi:hypothetical protein MLD38_013299 [Melastoma candidum]|uniref:Uncharacterized protein n=1 Tax=Melastoma candidum TaxID=119954 RepID=A0ACB9R993_9MYRT|nr:hypothetical protein MLD38_013299 [Melastoma candidum]